MYNQIYIKRIKNMSSDYYLICDDSPLKNNDFINTITKGQNTFSLFRDACKACDHIVEIQNKEYLEKGILSFIEFVDNINDNIKINYDDIYLKHIANMFFTELLNIYDSLSDLNDIYNSSSNKNECSFLADLIYLQNAILDNNVIDLYPIEYDIMFKFLSTLPSHKLWCRYLIKYVDNLPEYMPLTIDDAPYQQPVSDKIQKELDELIDGSLDLVVLKTRIPRALYSSLKEQAELENISVATLVRNALTALNGTD